MRQFIYNQDQISQIIEFLKSDKKKIPEFVGESKTARYYFLKRSESFKLEEDKLFINGLEAIPVERCEEILQKLYDDPKTFATGRDKFFFIVSERYSNISPNQVMKFLEKQKPYQLHKTVHRETTSKSFLTNSPNELWMGDTTHIDNWNGFGYLLNVIDIFSKYAYSVPIKDLTAKSITSAFEKIFVSKTPKSIQFDNGAEFKNKDVEALMKKHGIEIRYAAPHSPSSQSHIEIFNRHFKRLLYALMTKNKTRNWLQFHKLVLDNYNSTRNTTTKQKPKDLQEEAISGRNLDQIAIASSHMKSNALKRMERNSRFEEDLKIGDSVRVISQNYKLRRKNPLIKGYIPQYEDRIYKIRKIVPGDRFTRERYKLDDSKLYFAWELQKINEVIDNPSKIDTNKSQPSLPISISNESLELYNKLKKLDTKLLKELAIKLNIPANKQKPGLLKDLQSRLRDKESEDIIKKYITNL